MQKCRNFQLGKAFQDDKTVIVDKTHFKTHFEIAERQGIRKHDL
jgi:hypothetical protein